MDKDTLLTSFGKWVAPLNSNIFEDWKDNSTLDRYVKKLSTLVFLFLFIEAQIQKRSGLRSIMRTVQADEELQKALGISSISAAQLSRKNNKLDPEVLQNILCDLMTKLHRLQSPVAERIGPVKVIDSTTISLCLKKYGWAEFRKTKAGVKLHLRVTFLEPGTVYPDKAVITPAKPADHTQMDVLMMKQTPPILWIAAISITESTMIIANAGSDSCLDSRTTRSSKKSRNCPCMKTVRSIVMSKSSWVKAKSG